MDHPPCTVTADYAIKLLRPTPTDRPIELRARVIESTDDRAIVEGELIAHGKVTARLVAELSWRSSRVIRPIIAGDLECASRAERRRRLWIVEFTPSGGTRG